MRGNRILEGDTYVESVTKIIVRPTDHTMESRRDTLGKTKEKHISKFVCVKTIRSGNSEIPVHVRFVAKGNLGLGSPSSLITKIHNLILYDA